MTNYENGVRRERILVNKARENGLLAFRSAGSHSPIDVFILNPLTHEIHLIQCKPKSMSKNKKHHIEEELKVLEGAYQVITQVT